MEQRFADLLSDVFSEMSAPSFLDEEMDCDNLNFDENFEKERTSIPFENIPTKENKALQQDVTDQTAVLFCIETKDTFMAKNVDEDLSDQADFQCVEVVEAQEEDCKSSDGDSAQQGSVPGEDEEDEDKDMGAGEEPEELLMWVHCNNEFCDGNKEGRVSVEGQPLAPEGAENPQVRNEEQGESESDEDVSYFERVPEHGSGMMIKTGVIEEDEQDREEEKQEDSSDSEGEAMKTEQKENVLTLCLEQEARHPCCESPEKASLEFPDTVVQNLQELIAEVDSDEYVEEVKDFSDEKHQDGGESLADYPSDFSSCEYTEDGGKTRESYKQSTAKQDSCQERAVTDTRQTGRAKDSDEDRVEHLHSVDTEVAANMFSSLDVVRGEKEKERTEIAAHMWCDAAVIGCETGQRDSYSSTDDEAQTNRSEEELFENVCLQNLENNKQLGELPGGRGATFAMWSTYDDHNRADFNIKQNPDMLTAQPLLSVELLTAEDVDNEKTLLTDITLCPAEGVSACSAAQRGEARNLSPSNQGSLDDSFFFNTELEASGVFELGQLGDDEYEEERNWEQEQERIKAFYEFYDDSDEQNGKEERQIKVQFCTDLLSEVIHYETDSSDRDSLSSSTDGDGDLSSTETSEELRESEDVPEMTPTCNPPNTQQPETVPELSKTQNCSRKHQCLDMLKATVKMGMVTLMGLLLFWWATDQAGWLSEGLFF